MNVWMASGMDGSIDGSMAGWTDGWTDGWMDEYIMNLPRLTPEEMDNILMDGF